jgi:hypothetical protein
VLFQAVRLPYIIKAALDMPRLSQVRVVSRRAKESSREGARGWHLKLKIDDITAVAVAGVPIVRLVDFSFSAKACACYPLF